MDVSTAARLCDGALVVIDALEGVCIQTQVRRVASGGERVHILVTSSAAFRMVLLCSVTWALICSPVSLYQVGSKTEGYRPLILSRLSFLCSLLSSHIFHLSSLYAHPLLSSFPSRLSCAPRGQRACDLCSSSTSSTGSLPSYDSHQPRHTSTSAASSSR
jgi:hypothetical protein